MPTAATLVTDLVASTELRARLGEEQAERLRRLHDRLLRTGIETHGGVVVKGLGDGVLASFPEASGAVAAAVAVQQAADAHTRHHPLAGVQSGPDLEPEAPHALADGPGPTRAFEPSQERTTTSLVSTRLARGRTPGASFGAVPVRGSRSVTRPACPTPQPAGTKKIGAAGPGGAPSSG